MTNNIYLLPGDRVVYKGSDLDIKDLIGTIQNNLYVVWDNSNIRSPLSLIYNDLVLIVPSQKKDESFTITEAECKVCSKMNDIGIAKCWWCTSSNPTG